MWPGTASSGGWRSPQASAGTPSNTREPAQTDKKKPQLITVGASVFVGPEGLEPSTKGLCLPLRLSPPLSGLWSGLCLPVTGWPSSLYTFSPCSESLARRWRIPRDLAFADFDQFYL